MEKIIIIIVLSFTSTLCSFGQDTLKGRLSFEYYYGDQIREKENAYKSKSPFFIFSDLKKKLKPSNFAAYFAYVDSSDNNRIVGFKVCLCDTTQQNQLRRHLINLDIPRLLLFIRYKKKYHYISSFPTEIIESDVVFSILKYDFRKIKKGQGIKTEKKYSDEILRYQTVNLDRKSRGSLGYAYTHHHKKGSIKELRREIKPFKKVFKKLNKKCKGEL